MSLFMSALACGAQDQAPTALAAQGSGDGSNALQTDQRPRGEQALMMEMLRQRDRTIRDLRKRLKEIPPDPVAGDAAGASQGVRSALDRSLERQGGSLLGPREAVLEVGLSQAYTRDGRWNGRTLDLAARVGLGHRTQFGLSATPLDSTAPAGQRRWPRLGLAHELKLHGQRHSWAPVVQLGWQRTTMPVGGAALRDDAVDLSLTVGRAWAPVVATGNLGLREQWHRGGSPRVSAHGRTLTAGTGITPALNPDLAVNVGLQLQKALTSPWDEPADLGRYGASLSLDFDVVATPTVSVGAAAVVRLVGDGPRFTLSTFVPWSF